MSSIRSADQAAKFMYLDIDSEAGKDQLATVGAPKISNALHGHFIAYYHEGIEMIVHSSAEHPLPWQAGDDSCLYVGSISLLSPAVMSAVDKKFKPYCGKLWGKSTFESSYEQIVEEHGTPQNPERMLPSLLYYEVAERWAYQFCFDRDLKQLKTFNLVPVARLVDEWLQARNR